jgi:hypothetical protein
MTKKTGIELRRIRFTTSHDILNGDVNVACGGTFFLGEIFSFLKG